MVFSVGYEVSGIRAPEQETIWKISTSDLVVVPKFTEVNFLQTYLILSRTFFVWYVTSYNDSLFKRSSWLVGLKEVDSVNFSATTNRLVENFQIVFVLSGALKPESKNQNFFTCKSGIIEYGAGKENSKLSEWLAAQA